jgi:hypothetical protein
MWKPDKIRDPLQDACAERQRILLQPRPEIGRGPGHVVRRILRGLCADLSDAPASAPIVPALAAALLDQEPRAAGPAILATIGREAARYERGLVHATLAAQRYLRSHREVGIEQRRAMLRHTWGLPSGAIDALVGEPAGAGGGGPRSSSSR